MRNPILIKKETQEGEVKGKINTHPPKPGNRTIVNFSNIAIIIYDGIENSVPPDKGGNEVADEKRT